MDTKFYKLILYLSNLQKVFISCSSFLVDYLGSLNCTIMSYGNKDTLNSYFSICSLMIS